MKRKIKRFAFCFLLLALALTFLPSAHTTVKVQASAKSEKMYKARAKRAKKRLPKKVKKLLSPGYDSPTCEIQSSKRKGKYLYCDLAGSIGWGAYEIKVKVNLKTGKCHVTENMVSIPDYFKIKVK